MTRRLSGTLGIVADDLTGASDSAVQFAGAGWPVSLLLQRPEPGVDLFGGAGSGVVALTSDARALRPDAAVAASSSTVERAIAAGARHLFIKIDSTMRGSVSAQIEGAMSVWRSRHPRAFAVVCPAYPRMARTVENAMVRVNGQLLQDSAAGCDPVTPLTTSALAELLPGAVRVETPWGATADGSRHDTSDADDAAHSDDAALAARFAAALAAAADAAESGGRLPVLTVDASTDEHLARIAGAIAALDGRAVPVGSAGLALAMTEAWSAGTTPSAAPAATLATASGTPGQRGADRRIAVVVSSLHEVARMQVGNLAGSLGAAVTRWSPPLTAVLSAEAAECWADREIAGAAVAPDIALLVSPASESPQQGSAAVVAKSLAAIACQLIEHHKPSALILVGGDGARAVLESTGATALRIVDHVAEGVARGLVVGGRLDGLEVVTKAGGFGAPDTLTDVVQRMRSGRVAPLTGP